MAFVLMLEEKINTNESAKIFQNLIKRNNRSSQNSLGNS